MSDSYLREDIDATFRELREKFGIDEDEEGEPALTRTPSGELRLTPPSPPEELDTPPEPPIPDPEPPASTEDAASVEVEEEDYTYPGSRHVRRSVLEDPEPEDEPVWDAHSRVYAVKGEEREFFTISALATALRRESVTMRKWEERGYLPRARYRAPGAGKKRDRLYTRAQIEGLVKIAKEEGLMNPQKKKRIDQTNFADRAFRLFGVVGEEQ